MGNTDAARVLLLWDFDLYMYYADHAPPHFYAIYGEYEVAMSIHEKTAIKGRLPRRASSLVTEWATIHEAELIANWDRARRSDPLDQIEPLD